MVGQKVRALMLYFLHYIVYISCLQLKKVNVAHDATHNNYLYNHTAYYHVLQQVIAFLVTNSDHITITRLCNILRFFTGIKW